MTGLKDLIHASGRLLSYSLILLVGIALLVFLWGLARTIIKGGGEKDAEEGRNIATWGLIALFVMLSVWGIVAFMQRELGLTFGSYGGEATHNLPSENKSFLFYPAKQPEPGKAPEPGILPTNNFWNWFFNNPAKQPQPGVAPIPNSLNPQQTSSGSSWWSRLFNR